MKGVVFTEFLEMVEARYSANMVDDIIDDANSPSAGAYNAVGTYSHEELVALVSALSRRTGVAVPELLKTYGEHLFGRFVRGYPRFFSGISDAFDFLAGIESIIHAEVRKLYPDAELPGFEVERRANGREMVLIYESNRHFEDLAEGLMRGCAAHFGDNIAIQRSAEGEGHSRRERFLLTRS